MPSSAQKSDSRRSGSSGSSQGGRHQDGDDASYSDHSQNDLTIVSGAALIMADCLGTGILALPADIRVHPFCQVVRVVLDRRMIDLHKHIFEIRPKILLRSNWKLLENGRWSVHCCRF